MSPKQSLPLVAAALAALAVPALADETGLHVTHELRREGGRLCFADHWHYGSGSGPSKKVAQAQAISSWSSFVDLEYGSDWARFSRAAQKAINCSPAGGGAVDCQIDARPCK
jgi:hypothetical protein